MKTLAEMNHHVWVMLPWSSFFECLGRAIFGMTTHRSIQTKGFSSQSTLILEMFFESTVRRISLRRQLCNF